MSLGCLVCASVNPLLAFFGFQVDIRVSLAADALEFDFIKYNNSILPISDP